MHVVTKLFSASEQRDYNPDNDYRLRAVLYNEGMMDLPWAVLLVATLSGVSARVLLQADPMMQV